MSVIETAQKTEVFRSWFSRFVFVINDLYELVQLLVLLVLCDLETSKIMWLGYLIKVWNYKNLMLCNKFNLNDNGVGDKTL